MKTDNLHIKTNVTDSTANASADSANVQHYKPTYVDGFGNDSNVDSIITPISQSNVLSVPTGESSQYFMPSPLHDTGTMTMFLLSMFMVTFSLRSGFKYFTNFRKNLFSLKKRENVFEDHNTVNEIITQITLIVNTCIMQGILLNNAITIRHPEITCNSSIFTYIIIAISIMALYYLLQLSAYYVLGYVFTSRVNVSLLLKGFNASQALLGLFLIPLVILLLVYPIHANTFIFLYIIVYLICRIIFIAKGFRIFFNNYTSIFYFILYLCSGEIIPVIATYYGIILTYSFI
ncbi:MAG: DUF4271 domain-containing protein [Muribaculaceae bacterium]